MYDIFFVGYFNRWLLINIKMLGNLVAFFTSIFCVIGKGHISPGILGMVVSYAIQVGLSIVIFQFVIVNNFNCLIVFHVIYYK